MIFFKDIFSQNEMDSSGATITAITNFNIPMQQTKYERRFGKVVPNGRTNLELKPEIFCNKEKFKKEFEKKDFSNFKEKEGLSTEDCVEVMLDKFLEIYDDEDWLIYKVDNRNS